jgi:hypothetical protein
MEQTMAGFCVLVVGRYHFWETGIVFFPGHADGRWPGGRAGGPGSERRAARWFDHDGTLVLGVEMKYKGKVALLPDTDTQRHADAGF